MEKIRDGIVFSDDIKRILDGANAFDYKYKFVPSDSVINTIRSDFKADTNKIFDGKVTIISEEEMMAVNDLIDGSYPVVTLDKIYISPDEKNIYFLDCTRINGTNEIVSRKKEPLGMQIERLASTLPKKEIIIADDVVFSGGVLNNIINRFKEYGIETVGIIASVSMNKAYEEFNDKLKYGIKTNYLMNDNVIDQICERDFYFGIAGSGIMVETDKGMYKAPYFKPYGNPYERASIPKEYEEYFSKGCLNRSIYLWEEIDKLRKMKTLISELPEKIVNTNENEEVVRTLKLERNRL